MKIPPPGESRARLFMEPAPASSTARAAFWLGVASMVLGIFAGVPAIACAVAVWWQAADGRASALSVRLATIGFALAALGVSAMIAVFIWRAHAP
jgi:hypothetical protein